MLESVSRHFAWYRTHIDFRALSTSALEKCMGRNPSRRHCLHMKLKAGNSQHHPRQEFGSSASQSEQHSDVQSSSDLKMKIQADMSREKKQKFKHKDSKLGHHLNDLPLNKNIYLHESLTSTEPQLGFKSNTEYGSQSYDILSNDLPNLRDSEQGRSLPYSWDPNGTLEGTNNFSLNHMPDFRHMNEIHYTVTRKRIIRQKFALLFSPTHHEKAHAAAQKLIRYRHTLMFCCPDEVYSCMQILKKLGVSMQQLVKNLDLLLQPSEDLKAREQLVHDLGLHSSMPILCLQRLEDLMEIPEAELIERSFLPHDSSVLERLLSKLGSDCIQEEQLQQQLSKNNTMKETYNMILAEFLAQRLGVTRSSTESLLQSFQPTFKPLSQYIIIADIITKHLRLDFEQVCKQPALLDLSPHDTLPLLQLRPFVAGRRTQDALHECPDLGRIPHSLLQGWLQLLDTHGVEQFPLNGNVLWVLKQDLLVMSKLVLEFLVQHPQWHNIKSSHFLFEIFVNPSVMNDLMKEIPVTSCKRDSDPNVPAATKPQQTGRLSDAAKALEALEDNFDDEAATSRTGYDPREESALQWGSDVIARTESASQWDSDVRAIEEDEEQIESSDEDCEVKNDSTYDIPQGSATTADTADQPVQDEDRVMPFSADRDFQALPADLLDVSDKYITCYTLGNNALTFCSMKNRPNAEVKSYLQMQLEIDASEVNRVGRHGASPCSLPDAIAKLQLLLHHGYTKQQIAAAVEIFGFDKDLVSGQLCLMSQRYSNYESYWRLHHNVVNLLVYHVRKEANNTACDQNLG